MSAEAVVVYHTRDLLSSEQVGRWVRQAGARAVPLAAAVAAGTRPAAVVVEIGSVDEPQWQEALEVARGRWPDVPILAFGPHVDVAARQKARALGATQVLSRGRFFREGAQLIRSCIAALADPSGCSEEPDPTAQEGFRLFDAGEYYECHEVLEEAWRAEQRPCRALYQGILQYGIALYHIRRGHFAGALKMLQRAERHLRDLPDVCCGVDVRRLREWVAETRMVLLQLGPERLHEFPTSLFRKLPYARDVAS